MHTIIHTNYTDTNQKHLLQIIYVSSIIVVLAFCNAQKHLAVKTMRCQSTLEIILSFWEIPHFVTKAQESKNPF